ncbi:hypothetical protein [Saccharospirillum salsuginis]|uniref:YdhG-like domain-containing protein n=1 Tax=Saccharospirillum salsuginis TaxID=418750 RepID=A0A918ND19_9GAMM|nr:hypothetical protein [Saccharospirillum salsuginis]GGX59157.1 hypothetical protein GCM10007392_28650 [Saccharospirillum salsuginis]
MTVTTDTFANYPDPARTKLNTLRRWLLDVANEHELGSVTESLKWGEPSFQVKNGSTVRMDWKQA